MSTSTAFDLAASLAHRAETILQMYVADMGHLSEEQLGASPMGCARTALEFTAEVGWFNGMAARLVSGETVAMPSTEERTAAYAAIDTKDKAVALLNEGTHALIAAIKAAGTEGLQDTTTAPWGEAMPKHALAEMAVSHMWYHDGQVNYLQSCHGDGKFHWMED